MARTERSPGDEGRIEKFARVNTKKSLWILGGLAVGAVLLPPAAAAISASWAAGSGVETVASKYVHDRSKQKRLAKQKRH